MFNKKSIKTRVILRNDDLSNLIYSDKILFNGEIALARLPETNNFSMRIGTGNKTWNELSSSNIIIPAENISGLSKYIEDNTLNLDINEVNFNIDELSDSIISINNEIIPFLSNQITSLNNDLTTNYTTKNYTNELILNIKNNISNISTDVYDISVILPVLSTEILLSTNDYTDEQTGNIKDLMSIISNNLSNYVLSNDVEIISGSLYNEIYNVENLLTNYALSADVVNISENLTNNINNTRISITEYTDEQFFILSNEISSEVIRATNIENNLKLDIDNKIFMDDMSIDTLSIKYMSMTDFRDILENNLFLSNELYIISSEYTNMFGDTIINVGEPENSSDAATKNYIDSEINNIENLLTNYALSDDIDNKLFNISSETLLSANNYTDLAILNMPLPNLVGYATEEYVNLELNSALATLADPFLSFTSLITATIPGLYIIRREHGIYPYIYINENNSQLIIDTSTYPTTGTSSVKVCLSIDSNIDQIMFEQIDVEYIEPFELNENALTTIYFERTGTNNWKAVTW